MHIDIITDPEIVRDIRSNWDEIYRADPEAQFFLSWTWLSKWLGGSKSNWFVLGAKTDPDAHEYVALLPLRRRAKDRPGGKFDREITMGGNRAADYTGILCIPEFEGKSVLTFAKRLRDMAWDTLDLECIDARSERNRLFLTGFSRREFDIVDTRSMVNGDGVDNLICPYVNLPDDWESYLTTQLGSNTRQKARRFLRKVESSEEFRITQTTPETMDRDLDILFDYWNAKWAARKGDQAKTIVHNMRTMLEHCIRNDCLLMPMLWRGEEPLGGLATLIDRTKTALLSFVAGCDTSMNNPPPGFVLHAHSLRHAIENGFRTYDFLRGNEPYKYAFGTSEKHIRNVVVRDKKSAQDSSAGPRYR